MLGPVCILPETSVNRGVYVLLLREYGIYSLDVKVMGSGLYARWSLDVCPSGLWARTDASWREYGDFTRVKSYLQLARERITSWRDRVLLSRTYRHLVIATRWPLTTDYEIWIMRRSDAV